MRNPRSSRNGQALVMMTVSLLAMCGVIGMAVDFGWSFFVRRAEQSAADAAALAAANAAMNSIASGTSLSSLGGFSTAADCSTGFSDNRQSACLYATQNGFTSTGATGNTTVTVAADTTPRPPTVTGVSVHYWVTVRISQTVPQLYSAILGNANSTVAARATAAIVDSVVNGSLIALDRQADPGAPNYDNTASPPGVIDLNLASASVVTQAPGGVLLSSLDSGAGTNASGSSVGTSGNSSSLPYTMIRAQGSTKGSLNAGGTWVNSYQNQSDGPEFYDPMRNLGQPPLTTTALTARPVPGGTDWSTACPGGTCAPGVYFATSAANVTGGPLTINSSLNFSGGGTSFGDYVFFGGLNVSSGTVNLGPGRYVLAGVSDPVNNKDLSLTSNASITGGTGTDAGRLLIITDSSYPGLSTQVNVVNNWAAGGGGTTLPTLSYGQTNISPTTISMYGLDPTKVLPSDTNSQGSSLQDFGPILIWQDQGFSNVSYTQSGNINYSSSCGGSSMDSPCTQTPVTTPVIQIGAGQGKYLFGVVYQPRGAYLQLLPHASIWAQQVVSGAVDMQASSLLKLLLLSNTPKMRVVALVE